MWGVNVFSREEEAKYDPTQWKARLQEAMQSDSEAVGDYDMEPGRDGPEFVAAVCIRDHFDGLTADQVTWCVETICNAIESRANNWDQIARVQRYSMGGDRPSAFVISCLNGKSLPEHLRERLHHALPFALLHPVNEVRFYAAAGVGQHLWSSDSEMAIRCINALATEARMVDDRWRAERTKPFDQRADHDQIECEVGTIVREQFYGNIPENAYSDLDISEWTGAEANSRILSILARAPHHQLAIASFRRMAELLVAWWNDDDDRRGSSRRREHSIDTEIALITLFEEFVLKVSPMDGAAILEPILQAIDTQPEDAAKILQGIIGFEDRIQRTEQFWYLWELFAERVKRATWLKDIDQEHGSGEPMMAAVFLTQYWKENVRHWRSLEGHASRVHGLFEALPPSTLILDEYVRFLYYIGDQSLPSAFLVIANRMGAGNAQSMLRLGNTVFMLEALLRRYVYGRPRELKMNGHLREAVLYLLDMLVENGSSAAYRMRDDFVTPIS